MAFSMMRNSSQIGALCISSKFRTWAGPFRRNVDSLVPALRYCKWLSATLCGPRMALCLPCAKSRRAAWVPNHQARAPACSRRLSVFREEGACRLARSSYRHLAGLSPVLGTDTSPQGALPWARYANLLPFPRNQARLALRPGAQLHGHPGRLSITLTTCVRGAGADRMATS